MTAEELEALAERVRCVPEAIAGLEDDLERYRFWQLYSDLVGEVKPRFAVGRQDEFRGIKARRGVKLEEMAALLGITFGSARRIANAKLKRDEPGE